MANLRHNPLLAPQIDNIRNNLIWAINDFQLGWAKGEEEGGVSYVKGLNYLKNAHKKLGELIDKLEGKG